MPKHSLSLSEQVAGIKAALASKRTPNQLRRALRRHLRKLERRLSKRTHPHVQRPKFLGWFEF